MAIEGGVFTNLKLNGMVNSFPPFIILTQILTTMSLKLSQNKGKNVTICL